MKIVMGSHLTNAANLSNDWGPALTIGRRLGHAEVVALGLIVALGGCARLGLEAPARGEAVDRGEAEGRGEAETLDAPALAPAGMAYDVTVEGVSEDDLVTLLRQSSQLVSLRNRPPSSLAGLRRRAEGDRGRLESALRSEGFYGAKVGVDLDRSVSPIQVTLSVDTGDQYLLAEYEVRYSESPAPAPERQPSLEDLALHIGMPARAPTIVAAQRGLLELLARRGHPQAEVLNRETLVDHASKIMTVRLDLDAGPAARFGRVTLSGLETIEEDYPRGLLSWSAGEVYDKGKVESARRALSRSGLFSSVAIEPAARLEPDGTLPVEIAVVEAKHRSIGFGADYSTSEGIGGEVFWEHRNLFGRNEQLRLGLTAAEIEQTLSARFRKPSFLRPDQDLLVDGELAKRNTNAFEEQSFTGTAALERPYGERWRLSAGLKGEYSSVTDDDGETTFQLFGLPLAATYDSSDNLLDPTEGARLRTTVTPYTGMGDDGLLFAVGTVSGSAYRALDADRRFVLAGRVKLGSVVGEETDNVPANKRFFAGGGGSIRGYEFQSVGPLDAKNEPLGGRSLIELNAEVRVRITEQVGLVPFVDGGTVFDSVYPDFAEDLRWAAGLGARYFSAIGPLRVDIAIPLNKREVDDSFQFYISLGQAF